MLGLSPIVGTFSFLLGLPPIVRTSPSCFSFLRLFIHSPCCFSFLRLCVPSLSFSACLRVSYFFAFQRRKSCTSKDDSCSTSLENSDMRNKNLIFCRLRYSVARLLKTIIDSVRRFTGIWNSDVKKLTLSSSLSLSLSW